MRFQPDPVQLHGVLGPAARGTIRVHGPAGTHRAVVSVNALNVELPVFGEQNAVRHGEPPRKRAA